jgi:hypothetical protein
MAVLRLRGYSERCHARKLFPWEQDLHVERLAFVE